MKNIQSLTNKTTIIMKTKLISRICGWVMAAVLAGGMFMSCNLAKVLNDVEDIANGETGVNWSESGNKLSCINLIHSVCLLFGVLI